ncbi:DeoR family transcriptional regulator [Salmonella enterica subsp. enterica serovar Newport]|nr:DeoR family transcriptional regulator [Salmonella enterica]EDB4569439.1 DeoR family transcriptional regulator [Salmonella enterica subsp. enterica serovar Panama]EHC9819184.1 DeoR family transcriptional regulator [Salmonella enterica subsp. enterica serovar Newport]
MKNVRHKNIIQLLNIYGALKVTFLAKKFSVTNETIRNDLNELAGKGLIKRYHGGASVELTTLDNVAITEIIHYLESQNGLSTKSVSAVNMKKRVCVLGSFNVDMISYLHRLPEPGESLLATNFIFAAGGKGCNQALAASYADAGVHFISKIGKDQFSDYAIKFITTSQISSSCIYQTDEFNTGTASVFVNENTGENMIAISPGANMAVTVDEILLQKEKIVNSEVILLQLETNQEALEAIIKIARENKIPVILNPAPYNERVLKVIHDIDYLTPNEKEAGLLSGVSITDICSARIAAMKIHEMGVKNVIITLGKLGVIAFDGSSFIHSPAYPSAVKNTTGAGDAFNGSLAAELSRGRSFTSSLKYACAFASLAVETENASDMPENRNVLFRMENTEYRQTITEK